MPELNANQIAAAVKGTPDRGAKPDHSFGHYHFDTRLIKEPGTLFFAIKGETADGHDHVGKLAADKNLSGAGAVVARDFDASGVPDSFPLIRVDDPLTAAQDLARHVRGSFPGIKYIGVTGSAGKTTTKEFIYQILSHKYRAYRSQRNWNNWIGMPFSMLNMSGREEAAVFELAMSYPGIGEIDLLAGILRPNVAVILNVYPVHLEFLKTIDNTATAKSEILNYLGADDVAVINGQNEPLIKLLSGTAGPKGLKIHFGVGFSGSSIDIRLKEIIREQAQTWMVVDFYGQETRFVTPLVNELHIKNLFVAIIVARQLGMNEDDIREAVSKIVPLSNRGEIREYQKDGGPVTVIDETYNSNPEALKQTMDWVNREYTISGADQGEKIAVVGDMLELGEQETRFHRDVGHFFTGLDFHRLVTVGKRALQVAEGAVEKGFPRENTRSFDSAAEAGAYLEQTVKAGSVLLFKASRGIQLEIAVEVFLK